MGFDEKRLLKSENLHKINNFSLSNRDKLVIRHHSAWPGRVFSAETTLIQKHIEPFSDNNHLGFIYETNLPPGYAPESSDEEDSETESKFEPPRPSADSFYWRTSQKHIQDAIDYGIFDPGALTSKVIGALGAYRLVVLERAYDKGTISNKFEQKEMLLRLTQARIRSLEELERLTNAYDYGSSLDSNTHRIIDTFENYIGTLMNLREQVRSDLTVLNLYDEEAQTKIQNQITADILSAEKFRDELISAWGKNSLNQKILQNTVLSATGPQSVAHFIKLRMIAALRECEEHNQNMTYGEDLTAKESTKAFSRGQLNNFCADAMRIINEHQPDHHNPTLREHQGHYDEPDKSITINFQHLGKNRQRIRQTLMAITQIEGKDVIAKADKSVDEGSAYYIVSGNKKHKLKTTRFTGWDVQDDKSYIPKRLFFWCWNFIFVGIIGGLIIDLLPNLWLGLRGKEPRSFVTGARLEFTPVCVEETQFIALADKINIPSVSLGAIVGRAIGNFVFNTAWEIKNGLKSTYRLARLQFFDHLIADYHIGHNPLPDERQLYKQISSDLNNFHAQEKEFLKELEDLHLKAGVKEFSKIRSKEIVSRHAQAPYELNPGEWSDALNSALNGAKFILEAITHEVHAKHPFAALLFNFFYITGGLAILAPQYVSFLGQTFLQISKAIADAASTEPFAGAISASFYEAYLAATVSELITSGRDSGLISALTSLEDQPSSFMIYGTLAVGFGWFLANVVDIPGISGGIREELGKIPAITYGAAGAKFGLVLLELFAIEPGEPDSEYKVKREKLKHFFNTEYPEFTDERVDGLIDDLLKQTLAVNAKPEARNAMHRLQFLMKLQQHQQYLPYLSNLKKRQLIEVMRRQEQYHPHIVDALEHMLFPEHKKSILGITLNIILGYVWGLGRCLASVVTWNKEPFRYLFLEKVPKDVARLYHALHNKILNTFFNYLRAMGRGLCDIVINEIIARTEGFFRSTHHSVSSRSYAISSKFDQGFATLREFFARVLGIDPLRKAVTKPHATSVLRSFYHKFRYGYNAKPDVTEISNEIPALPSSLNSRETNTITTQVPVKPSNRRPRLQLNRTEQLIKQASVDINGVPHVIREFLRTEKSRKEFFKTHFVLDDDTNVFYYALKNSDLNYEILIEILQANAKLNPELRYNAKQTIQVICLDREGNIVIDLLKKQLELPLGRDFLISKEFLSAVLKNFHTNSDVLSHLSIKPKTKLFQNFLEAVRDVYNDLYKSDIKAAFTMLSALIDNPGTQSAMLDFFRNCELFDKASIMIAKRSNPQLGECIDKLYTQIASLAKIKPNSGWEEVAKGMGIIATIKSEPKITKAQTDASLFRCHQDNGLTFFSLSPTSRTSFAGPITPRKTSELSYFKGNISY